MATIEVERGTFDVEIYQVFNSTEETPSPQNQRSLGANIYLEFSPKVNRQDRDIEVGIVQFINPITMTPAERARATAEGWTMDRGTHTTPYYGMTNQDSTIPLNHATVGTQDLRHIRYVAEFGYTRKGKVKLPAKCADTPRDFIADVLSHRTDFVTLAHDAGNQILLGAITWGYAQKSGGDVALIPVEQYALTDTGEPRKAQADAIEAWNHVPGNTPLFVRKWK